MVIMGDDNFTVGNVPVKSGILEVSSNTPLEYTQARHEADGNFAFGDGSVYPVSDVFGFPLGFQWRFGQCGLATNRLAIP